MFYVASRPVVSERLLLQSRLCSPVDQTQPDFASPSNQENNDRTTRAAFYCVILLHSKTKLVFAWMTSRRARRFTRARERTNWSRRPASLAHWRRSLG